MRERSHTKTGKRVSTVVLCLLLLLSIGLSAYFAAASRTSDEALRALQTEYETTLTEKEQEIAELSDALTDEKTASEEEIARLNEELASLAKTKRTFIGVASDLPAYTEKYPDFYAPQALKADYSPENTCYLTFDDGPSANTQSVLSVLAEYDIKATFFVVTKSGYSEETLKAISDAGHTIGMHSCSHDYKKIYASVEAYLDDMYQVFTEIRRVTGITPTVFRFPGGSVNAYNHNVYQEILAEMLRRGFVPFDWNVSSGDATKNTVEKDLIVSNTVNGCTMSRPVVLMHDGAKKTTTVEALPEIIEALIEKGYSFEGLRPDSKPVTFQYIDKLEY